MAIRNKLTILALIVLSFVGCVAPKRAIGQTVFVPGQALGVNPFKPTPTGQSTPVFLPYAQVRVCTYSAAPTIPCSPTANITDVFGTPLSIVGGNFGQLQTDVIGRYNFGCNFGNFTVQIAPTGSNTPLAQYAVTCPSGPTSPIILGTANVWTSTNTFNQQVTFNTLAPVFNVCASFNVSGIDFTTLCPTAGGPFNVNLPHGSGTLALNANQAFTGVNTVPTPTLNDVSLQIANTTFVKSNSSFTRGWIVPGGNDPTALSAIGMFTAGAGTSPSYNSLIANGVDPQGIEACTNVAANNLAGVQATGNVLTLGGLSTLTHRVQLTSTTNERVWIGAAQELIGTNLVSDTPSTPMIAFRYSTAAGDTTWKLYNATGGGGTNLSDSGVTPDGNSHKFVITYNGTTVSFIIDGNTVGTSINNLPSISSGMGPVVALDNVNLGNVKCVRSYYALFTSNF